MNQTHKDADQENKYNKQYNKNDKLVLCFSK